MDQKAAERNVRHYAGISRKKTPSPEPVVYTGGMRSEGFVDQEERYYQLSFDSCGGCGWG